MGDEAQEQQEWWSPVHTRKCPREFRAAATHNAERQSLIGFRGPARPKRDPQPRTPPNFEHRMDTRSQHFSTEFQRLRQSTGFSDVGTEPLATVGSPPCFSGVAVFIFSVPQVSSSLVNDAGGGTEL